MALWLLYIMISHHSLQNKVQMTKTEPLNEDGSPPHHETQTVKLEMEDKMVQIKKMQNGRRLGG